MKLESITCPLCHQTVQVEPWDVKQLMIAGHNYREKQRAEWTSTDRVSVELVLVELSCPGSGARILTSTGERYHERLP